MDLKEQCKGTLGGVAEPEKADAMQVIAEPAPSPSFPI